MSTRRWRSRRSARPFAAHSPESVPTGIPERTSIFVTVGTELPFDRLVRAIDHWAGERGRGSEVFAQIGRTQFRPEHIGWAPLIDGNTFDNCSITPISSSPMQAWAPFSERSSGRVR